MSLYDATKPHFLHIFTEYLYNPRHEPIDMNMLYSDLKDLGNFIHLKLKGNVKTSSLSKTSSLNKAAGIFKKTKKNKNKKMINKSKTSISFKRRPKQKRFKNPFFLSLK